MRIKHLIFSSFLLCGFYASPLLGGAESGRTEIKWDEAISPYAGGKPLDVVSIERVRQQANTARVLISQDKQCNNAFLYWLDSSSSNDFYQGVKHYFRLDNPPWKMGFAEIKSITIKNILGEITEVDAIVFPRELPYTLVNNPLSYDMLTEKYQETITLKIRTVNESTGQSLAIGCTSGDWPEQKVDQLTPGQSIVFSYNAADPYAPIWWAVDSVASSDNYPYKLKKSIIYPNMKSAGDSR
ncbi:hypothetical protein [Dasania marina]|uniref:hypothetical protein n=1 Tax=Dasania marina TaxID=471499 RepID=UPI000363BE94|nr:hypothetical protein [Dasania marina]